MAEPQTEQQPAADSASDKKRPIRQIPGNLPYTSSLGVFKRALEKLIEGEKPTTFNRDFLGTVLGVSGGAANPVIPILKKTGFLTDSGAPTEIYADFQTNSGRANAALLALKRGFSEIFRKNQYAHKADKSKIVDIIRSVTGLPSGDPVIGYIYGTFNALQEYAKGATETSDAGDEGEELDTSIGTTQPIHQAQTPIAPPLGLSYQINIILPETSNIEVFNAIFKSLRDNLLR